MSAIVCKGCGAADYVKNGTVRGLQRYRCKACGCNFTMTKARGKPPAMKALAVLLYTMGNMSFCGIARLLAQVSPHFLTRPILTLFSSRTEEFYDRKGNLTWHPFIKRGGRNKILNQIARIASIFGSNFYL